MKYVERYLDTRDSLKLEKIAAILKTVAHPTRLSIIHILNKHEQLSVSDICHILETEQSLTSHHLLTLRLRGLIAVERKGRSKMYSLKEKDLVKLMECLDNCHINL